LFHSWYFLDDTKVSRVSVDEVLNANAYLLFYEKSSIRNRQQELLKQQVNNNSDRSLLQSPSLHNRSLHQLSFSEKLQLWRSKSEKVKSSSQDYLSQKEIAKELIPSQHLSKTNSFKTTLEKMNSFLGGSKSFSFNGLGENVPTSQVVHASSDQCPFTENQQAQNQLSSTLSEWELDEIEMVDNNNDMEPDDAVFSPNITSRKKRKRHTEIYNNELVRSLQEFQQQRQKKTEEAVINNLRNQFSDNGSSNSNSSSSFGSRKLDDQSQKRRKLSSIPTFATSLFSGFAKIFTFSSSAKNGRLKKEKSKQALDLKPLSVITSPEKVNSFSRNENPKVDDSAMDSSDRADALDNQFNKKRRRSQELEPVSEEESEVFRFLSNGKVRYLDSF
jgi:hypothetical protein